MHAFLFFISACLLAPATLAAPTLDPASLLANGLQAQLLNGQFANIKETDPCIANEIGCVGGKFSQCGPQLTWVSNSCPGNLACFALPLVNKVGSTITCTTEDDALARIEATGAAGGISSPDGDGDDCPADPGSPSTTPSFETTASFTTTFTASSGATSGTAISSAASSSAIATLSFPPDGRFVSATITSVSDTATATPASSVSGTVPSVTATTVATITAPGGNPTGTAPISSVVSVTGTSTGLSSSAPAVTSAPAPFARQNALDAQAENLRAQSLQADAPCGKPGKKTCITGQLAFCDVTTQTWKLMACPFITPTKENPLVIQDTCFNVPRPDQPGVSVGCLKLNDALARFAAAGVTGGVDGKSG
jgi:hypothetical protein